MKRIFITLLSLFVFTFSACAENIKTNYEFYIACANNDVKSVKKYLRKNPQSANAELTPIEYKQFAKYLINEEKTVEEHIVDRQDWINTYKSYPIIIASERGYVDIVKLLINANAYLDVGDKEQNTALIQAARYKQNEVISELIAAGADINAENENDVTAFDAAIVQKGSMDIVVNLYKNGARPSFVYKYRNESPLHYVKDTHVARLLLRDPVIYSYINHKDVLGNTPLMERISSGNYDVAKVYIENGANTHIANKDGETALDIAKKKLQEFWTPKEEKLKLEEVIELLEKEI